MVINTTSFYIAKIPTLEQVEYKISKYYIQNLSYWTSLAHATASGWALAILYAYDGLPNTGIINWQRAEANIGVISYISIIR